MDLAFFYQKEEFHPFTYQHGIPLLVIALFGCVCIFLGKRLKSEEKKWRLLFYISLLPFLAYVMYIFFKLNEGTFSAQEDLPLHVCRTLAFVCPLVIYYRHRFFLGVFYFWILVGTLNANLSPDILYNFPHWNYITYFLLHGVLVILPIYYVAVLKVRIGWRDLLNAFWTANVFLIFSLLVNWLIGSNYMYTMRKPAVASLLDMMGEWPYYLLTTQLLAVVLFVIVLLPLLLIRRLRKNA